MGLASGGHPDMEKLPELFWNAVRSLSAKLTAGRSGGKLGIPGGRRGVVTGAMDQTAGAPSARGTCVRAA